MKLQQIRDKYNSSTEFFQAILDGCIELAQEQPDFAYNPRKLSAGCLYDGPCVYKEGPDGEIIEHGPDCKGCIIGQSLQRMGWEDPNELKTGESASVLFFGFCDTKESTDILEKLIAIQSTQDKGASWGDAILATINEV